ncbi:MAG: glycosyltransferase [Pyrinomonadaceae bacterium]
MPIKSVHITNYYHKNSGGISTAYNKLLEGANRHRRYVRLIVPGEKSEVEEVGTFGRIYYVKAGYSPIFDKRYRILWPWRTYFLDQSPIKTILREEKPDVIEIGEKYTLSLMAGLLRKGIMNVSEQRPMLVHFSCERMDDNVSAFIWRGRAAKRFTQAFIRNYLFPMFDFHLTNSDYTAEELREAVSEHSVPSRNRRLKNFCWRLLLTPMSSASNRVFVNQCGVDVEAFSAARKSSETRRRICAENNIPESATLLLYAGRISPEKNVALLPGIMKELSNQRGHDFRLILAGAGPEEEKLAAEFERSAKGKVKMLGHLNDKGHLADLFANCDAFVHPNPREPFGITPLEAMASGLPVAAPNSGGVLSYANDQNAWLCEPDAESFSAAVLDIIHNAEQTKVRIRNALDTARKYDWDSSVSSLFRAYDGMFDEFSKNRSVFVYKKAPKDFNFSKESISPA